jgi:hypothetical protein
MGTFTVSQAETVNVPIIDLARRMQRHRISPRHRENDSQPRSRTAAKRLRHASQRQAAALGELSGYMRRAS